MLYPVLNMGYIIFVKKNSQAISDLLNFALFFQFPGAPRR
jgi:hypothetical protein